MKDKIETVRAVLECTKTTAQTFGDQKFDQEADDALEAEVVGLRERLRNTAQILIECIGAAGPENAEDAARRAVRLIAHQSTVIGELEADRDQLRAQLAEYEAESATLTVGSKWPKGL